MTRSSLALVLCWCLGCTGDSRAQSGAGSSSERTQTDASLTGAPIVITVGRGLAASMPSHFVPMPEEQRQRIETGRTTTRGAKMELQGSIAPPGAPPAAAYVAEIRHTDRGTLYGETVSSFARFTLLGNVAALERELDLRLASTTTLDPSGKFVDLFAGTATDEPGGAWMRSRMSAPSAAVILEQVCFCTGDTCPNSSEACEFPGPPSDSIGINEPLYAGQPPERLELASGGGKVDVPPFYIAEPDAGLAGWQQRLAQEGPNTLVLDAVSRISPGSGDNYVRLAKLERCRRGPTCTPKAYAQQLVQATEKAGAGTRAELLPGALEPDGAEVQLTGLDNWERRVFLGSASGVTELRCACKGAACLVAAGTCALGAEAG